MDNFVLSPLNKTWIIDLDGTIVRHNGYMNGDDALLEGVHEFFTKIDSNDRVIIITARSRVFRESTIAFLNSHGIRFDDILFDMPPGERILINDKKPSGLSMAYAVDKVRDERFEFKFTINREL